jgi:RimJ/RimL family protein N-acetyltransferase
VGPFLPFTTARLLLRPFRPADAEAFAAYRSDPDIARYQSWATPFPVAQAHRLIDDMSGHVEPIRGDWLQIAVEHEGTLAGDVAVGLDADGHVGRVGYTLARAAQGRGLGAEAVGAVVDRLFATLGAHRVEASIDGRNLASARLLERLGFEHEGTSPSAVWDKGEWVDDVRYGISAQQHAAWTQRPRGRPGDVRLVEITAGTAGAVLELRTHPSQRRFVAPMHQSFADALFPDVVNGAPVTPWMRAIEADGELAGFVMMTAVTEHHREPYLWRLLIDRRHQRRGIGDRVVELLVDSLRDAGHTSLLVSWHPGPGGPEPFYLARGFVPTGVVTDDEIEARLTFPGITGATT